MLRHPSYPRTEDVVVLRSGTSYVGFRPANGGEHRYFEVGLEHIAFEVDRRDEVDEAPRPLHRDRREDPHPRA